MEQTIHPCVFCVSSDALLRNELAYARFDKYPVNPGHLLILPFRHVATYFDTTEQEKLALLALLEEGKKLLDKQFAPAGYNIGINMGESAGQTIMHLHIHFIPRYRGDCIDPRGGVRGVILSKQWYPVEA